MAGSKYRVICACLNSAGSHGAGADINICMLMKWCKDDRSLVVKESGGPYICHILMCHDYQGQYFVLPPNASARDALRASVHFADSLSMSHRITVLASAPVLFRDQASGPAFRRVSYDTIVVLQHGDV